MTNFMKCTGSLTPDCQTIIDHSTHLSAKTICDHSTLGCQTIMITTRVGGSNNHLITLHHWAHIGCQTIMIMIHGWGVERSNNLVFQGIHLNAKQSSVHIRVAYKKLTQISTHVLPNSQWSQIMLWLVQRTCRSDPGCNDRRHGSQKRITRCIEATLGFLSLLAMGGGVFSSG